MICRALYNDWIQRSHWTDVFLEIGPSCPESTMYLMEKLTEKHGSVGPPVLTADTASDAAAQLANEAVTYCLFQSGGGLDDIRIISPKIQPRRGQIAVRVHDSILLCPRDDGPERKGNSG
jgi:hypothetical protein